MSLIPTHEHKSTVTLVGCNFPPHFKFTETSLDLLNKQTLFENSTTKLRCNKYKHFNI